MVGIGYKIDSSRGVSNCGQITKVAECVQPCQTLVDLFCGWAKTDRAMGAIKEIGWGTYYSL
jgi:hypothetical protein